MIRREGFGRLVIALIVVVLIAVVLFVTGRQDAQSLRSDADRPTQKQTQSSKSSSSWSAGSSNAYAATPPAQETTLPPLGPGAVLEPDLGSAPELPAGTSAVDYVTAYYRLVLAGDLGNAWTMLPKAPSEATLDDYQRLLAPYQPKAFWISDATADATSETVTVLQYDPDNRSWNTVWTFVDADGRRVLKDVKYQLPGGGACH